MGKNAIFSAFGVKSRVLYAVVHYLLTILSLVTSINYIDKKGGGGGGYRNVNDSK